MVLRELESESGVPRHITEAEEKMRMVRDVADNPRWISDRRIVRMENPTFVIKEIVQ